MQCTNPVFILGKGTFPCGKCLNCRIAKSREWSLRLMNELSFWDKSTFITLTYDDDHLPEDHSLHKEELQKFFKRLRKNYGKPIKYFACGEYGEKVRTLYDSNGQGQALGRPHYHAIVFGLGRDEYSKGCVKDSWRFCQWQLLKDDKTFGSVTYDSCRYVSDYIFKKYSKELGQEVYGLREIPFKIGSNGLGLNFVLNNAEQLSENGFTTCRGVKVNLPRYYRLKLGIVDTDDDRFNRSFEESLKWRNFCIRHHYDFCDIGELQKQSREQRRINTERRAQLHGKGDL